MDRRELLAHLAMALSMAIFGGLNVVLEVALRDGLNPLIFGFYRDLIACPLLLIWTSATGRWAKIENLIDARRFFFLGFFGLFANQLFYVMGLNLTNANTAACYMPLCPVLTVLLAIFPCRYEQPSWVKTLGLVLAVAGSLLMVLSPQQGNADDSFSMPRYIVGNVMLLGNSLCGALFFLLQKPLFGRYSPDMVVTVAYVVANFAMLLCCLPFVGQDIWALSSGAFLAVLYGGVLCSAFSFQLITWANQHLDASISACYFVVQPVATILLAAMVLGQPVTWRDFVGCFVVLIGLGLLSSGNQQAITTTTGSLPKDLIE